MTVLGNHKPNSECEPSELLHKVLAAVYRYTIHSVILAVKSTTPACS